MLWKLAAIAALAACAVALPISGFFAEFEHAVEAQFKCELIWPISLSLHLYVSDVCVAISLPPSLQFHGSTLQLDVMRHFIRAISPPPPPPPPPPPLHHPTPPPWHSLPQRLFPPNLNPPAQDAFTLNSLSVQPSPIAISESNVRHDA